MGNLGPSGGGGICRNENDTFLFGFSAGYGVGSNNMAELRAIHDGMLLCLGRGLDRVIVASESKLLISSLTYHSKTPWKWNPWLSRINHLRRLGDFSFAHILREGNGAADGLSQEGSLLQQYMIYLHSRCLPQPISSSKAHYLPNPFPSLLQSLSNTQTRRKPLNLIERKRPKRGGVLGNCSANAQIGIDASVEVDENVLVPEEDEEGKGGDVVEYDWREEWYPLYLTEQVPDDSPLGLTVFDKQIVLYRDGNGLLCCYEDGCPHRLAKLSEGQLIDGRLECLNHGWQFDEDGKCIKIPQLPKGARIPHSACVRTYEVRDSQGVVWVWMADKNKADANKLPWFEHFARPGFQAVSSIHELPYDHSILLENLMDPAHVPI
ncbi:protein TIC 55, chloroplastic-like [Magnolia sinica]|uniref:protein TIC 55, chloroplastic-like n=1 Tax=Magnolia sinica TaxID=86752 RepID=UPI0026590EEE|nr:protein TIC 55, chloroplastic-like [Magnolia sinica]